MFISEAFANSGSFGGQDIIATVIQLGLIFIIFYFLLIRPQQNKVKDHNAMLMAIKAGDKVVTGGGIYAKVTKTDGMYVTVEIADNIQIVVNRITIRDIINEEDAKKAKNSEKPTKNKSIQAKDKKK